ncbi:MAG TPA: Tim44-like domain-containing protein [Rhodocyclaceae bacterium]
MKKFSVALFAALVGLVMLTADAEARRLGGGSSFGMQRTAPRTAPAPAPSAPTAAPAPAAPTATPQAPAPAPRPAGASRWLGPLAGLAAGIGLAALLSHFGLGEGFASILLLAALVFGGIFLLRMIFARRSSGPEYAGAGAPMRYEPAATQGGAGAAPAAAANIPADFDVAGFLRNAKLNFVRMQAANDAGNIEDLKQFTTPEVYAELKLQFDERGRGTQQTDVVQLDAELLGIETEETRHIASVRFHGMLREEAGAAPGPFNEIWHLTKPVDGSSGWVVAGIQQLQ